MSNNKKEMDMGGLWGAIRAGVSFLFTAITTFLISPELANKAYQVFAQFVQGFSPAVDINIVPHLIRAPHSRKVLALSAMTNLVCLASLLLMYEAGVRRSVRYGAPSVEDSYTEYGMDFFMRFCIEAYLFVDNLMLTTAIIKAAAIDNPENQRSCDCETTAKIQGKLTSTAYYGTSYAVAWAAEWLLPIAGIPLRSMLYGRYFVEQGAGGGMCVAHRNDVVNRNNAYSFGMGLSFLAALGASGYITRRVFGDDVVLVNDAIFNFLAHYFLMLSVHNSRSLPGREMGMDVSYPSRKLTDLVVEHTGGLVKKYINAPGQSMDWIRVKKELNRYPALLMQRFLLGADLSTEANRAIVLRRPIPRLLFNLYDPTIMTALKRLEQFPDKDLALHWGPFSVSYNTIINWLPTEFVRNRVPDYKLQVVKFTANEQYFEYINQMRALVAKIRSIQEVKEQVLAAEAARRDDELRFVDGGQPVLAIEPSPAAADQMAPAQQLVLPSVGLADEIASLPMVAAAATATPSLFTQSVQRRQPALSAPANTPVVPAFDAATVIKKIAGLDCWKSQGVDWGYTKVPGGVEEIRKASADLAALYTQISHKFDSGAKRGLPANMTNDFYVLIKDCYNAHHHQAKCKTLIDDFCTKHLNLAERQHVGLAPQQPLSGTGNRARR